jgi:flagellar biogenesis protein FliO
MTAADRRPRPVPGHAVSWFVMTVLSLMLYGTTAAPAQEGRPGDLPIEPSTSPTLENSEAKGTASDLGSIRVPRPSNERPLFAHGVRTSDGPARSPASSGWWLGSTGIALALAICGAACAASRRYWPQSSTGLVRVVGRVSLSPRQSIYLVRAGRRVIMIGAGGQGAPTLLGELSESEQSEAQDEAADPGQPSFPGLAGLAAPLTGKRTVTGADRRLGDVP